MVMLETEAANFKACVDFLQHIGMTVNFGTIEGDSFLPGLSIDSGCIIIDQDKLIYPGDILHEAGHIAVVPSEERATLNAESIGNRPNREAEEMMAIAWSYAACMHLEIDPYFALHEGGYKGGGNFIADNFKEKKYFGLPMLQWVGMTYDEKRAAELQAEAYPHMIKWMRD